MAPSADDPSRSEPSPERSAAKPVPGSSSTSSERQAADRTRRNRGASGEPPRRLGPGLVVAAAFVGPGTVITAANAGAMHRMGLAWVVLFAVLAAMVLQEMSARLGTLTGLGLGELLRRQFPGRAAITMLAILVVVAIGIGNAAYQTGNLTGAGVGIAGMIGVPDPGTVMPFLVITIGVVAAGLLASGSYRLIERVLIAAVAVMGLAFVVAAIVTIVSSGIPAAAWRPNLPADAWVQVLALIGTTIVPYNLFLHCSAAAERWSKVRPRDRGIRAARWDSGIGIAAGGCVTLAIMVAAAGGLPAEELGSASELAGALNQVLGGTGARIAFSIGLAAAGLTSAITAPLAAAYAVSGVLGWSTKPDTGRFRGVWLSVLLAGVVAGVIWGGSPAQTILLAQVANALVLPIVAVIVVIACNARILGKYANQPWHNAAAAAVIAVILLLCIGKWLL